MSQSLGNLYTIVCVAHNEAGEFNNNLRKEVRSKFRAKLSTLPAHFTIKSGFKYDGDVSEMLSTIDAFVKNERSQPYMIEGFGSFKKDVIYMEVKMSNEGKAMHDRLIDALDKIEYIKFDQNDGKDKQFHMTIASKNLSRIFDDIWAHVNQYSCIYNCMFDNVTVFKWGERTWEVLQEFKIPPQ